MLTAQLLRSTELSEFMSFVSPAFFKVLPARALLSKGRQLHRNYRDAAAFDGVLSNRDAELQKAGLPIETDVDTKGPAKSPVGPAETERYAQQVVELYFHQIFVGDTVVADLRSTALSPDGDGLRWHPAPVFCKWDPAFVVSLRKLYRGFYANDEEAFAEALEELRLQPAEALFRQHFGEGQDNVVFSVREFVSTFHNVFVVCKENAIELDTDFLVLGIYLAGLYENLERFDAGVDVRACFERVVRASTQG